MTRAIVSEIKNSKNPAEKILSHFLDCPESGFYGRELSVKLKISAGSVHGTLNKMYRASILRREKKGKTVVYFLNENNPTLKGLKIIHSIETVLPLTTKLAPFVQKIYLFGSSASGEYVADSDTDLLIVCLASDKKKVGQLVDGFSAKRPIQLILKTASEWLATEEKDPDFFEQVTAGINLFNQNEDGE